MELGLKTVFILIKNAVPLVGIKSVMVMEKISFVFIVRSFVMVLFVITVEKLKVCLLVD